MHPQKIKNLVTMSPKDRYGYFVRHCTDFEIIWGLQIGADNWVTFTDGDGERIFPLWPHEELANICCLEEQRRLGARACSMSIYSFLEKCVPDMNSKNINFGVFYDLQRKGIVISGKALKDDLENELATHLE